MAGSRVNASNVAYDALGPIGCDVLMAAGETIEAFSWETEGKNAVELELILYVPENGSAEIIPRSVLWNAEHLAHGGAVHEFPPRFTGVALEGNTFWPLPANGMRCRFSARAVRIMVFNVAGAKRLRGSLQPVLDGGRPQPLPDATCGFPSFGGVLASAFPIGAREFRMECANPARLITMTTLNSLSSVVGLAQPVAAYVDWSVIPIEASLWQPDAGPDLVTAIYR